MPYAKDRSLTQRRFRWSRLTSNRRKILEELPHLVGDLDELARIDKEIGTLQSRQSAYQTKAREITAKIRALAKKGDNLRGRIGSGIRWKHGFDGEALVLFGFKPRRSKRHLEQELGEVAPVPGEEEPTAPQEDADGA